MTVASWRWSRSSKPKPAASCSLSTACEANYMSPGKKGPGQPGSTIACPEENRCIQWEPTHQRKSQTSVAWIAFVEETKRMKSINKAILGMVSESLGRNESERTGDPEKPGPRGRARGRRAKAVWTDAN